MGTFKMPSLGADMKSAVLMEWKVKPGDTVKKGDILAEVETSKGVIEIEVFESGTVEKLLVEVETECEVGAPLAEIKGEGEAAAKPAPEPAPEPKKEEPAPPKAKAESASPKKAAEPIPGDRPHISPAARKRAEELGVDLAALAASVKGEIHLSDIEAAAGKQPEKPKAKPASKAEAKKSSSDDAMRQAIAAAMSKSNAEIPHYYLSTSINMTPALEWLEIENAKRSIKERILPAALMIRAVVKALQAIPKLNGFWVDGGHQVSPEIHPGIAIALRSGGLITPALLDAQDKDLTATMSSLGDLITRTRAGKLRSTELTKQTITITNLGDLGVERVYGVIYPPQVAIVGLGRIMDAPWAEGDTLAVRKVMQATLAGDHRATDGRTGAQFLDTLNKLLQNPEGLL